MRGAAPSAGAGARDEASTLEDEDESFWRSEGRRGCEEKAAQALPWKDEPVVAGGSSSDSSSISGQSSADLPCSADMAPCDVPESQSPPTRRRMGDAAALERLDDESLRARKGESGAAADEPDDMNDAALLWRACAAPVKHLLDEDDTSAGAGLIGLDVPYPCAASETSDAVEPRGAPEPNDEMDPRGPCGPPSEASDELEPCVLMLARRCSRLCGASLYVAGAWPGRSRMPRPKSVDVSSDEAVDDEDDEPPPRMGARALTGELCADDDDDECDGLPRSSDKAGPNVRDGAAVTAVEVMRPCGRGLWARLLAVEPLRDVLGDDGVVPSGTVWTKQQRLPYGHAPSSQKVRQISDLNCGREGRASDLARAHAESRRGRTLGWRGA